MSDFLLELLSEEIPARMQDKACADLARLFAAELEKSGIKASKIETFATPRRLALIARGLPAATEAVTEEVKGPRADAPAQAIAGFLGKTGLAREQLVERADAKGNVILFAVTSRPGRPTADVLSAAVPGVIRAFPWPKSMRWGAASATMTSLRWVRPLQGIVALFGDDVVACELDGIVAGAVTLGHRFHHPGPITIGNAGDYAFKLRAAHVILDQAERRAIIAEGAAKAAAAAGLTVLPDDALVAENAGLTEWPVPLLGRFDPAFLKVPREVIQLTMRTNQKYFACADATGALAPAFVCTANIDAVDGGAAIVAGNQKVLAARLSDAKFFWEQDLKVPLGEWAGTLDRIVFHEKLGTLADKVARVAKLARWLVEEGIVGSSASAVAPAEAELSGGRVRSSPQEIPAFAGMTDVALDRAALADMAEQAARLAKADLVTGMVGEFPELQGVMGGYYARAEGLPDAVADAIRDHYKPVGQGDEVPTAPVTVAVSLADKLDNLVSFFAANILPTGSKDPFALRRAMIGAQSIIDRNGLRLKLSRVVPVMLNILAPKNERGLRWIWGQAELRSEDIETGIVFSPQTLVDEAATLSSLLAFFADRLKVQLRESGIRYDLIDAVLALDEEDDLIRLIERLEALRAFVGTEDGVNLLAGYARAANILRIEEKKDGASAYDTPAGAGVSGGRAVSSPRERPASAGMTEAVRGGVPILSNADEQGIAQTGEEDPLVMVEDPDFAEAVAALDARAAARSDSAREPAEAALITALDAAEPRVAAAVAEEDFGGAMQALATLRAPIDAFFEQVTVNDPDRDKRAARLALLDRIRVAMHNVADFSKIEG